jgi:ABC-type sugar transport system substrate-binding protein
MKKLTIILLLTILLISIFTFAISAKTLKVGFVANNMQADSNVLAAKGMEDYCDRMGWEFQLTDCQGDLTKLSSNMINLISAKVDAVVLTCGEKTLIEEGVMAAEKAGIPVFLSDTENIGNTIVNGTSNCWAMGAFLASQTVDRMRAVDPDKKVHNVCIIGMPDLYVHRQRQQMMEAVFNSPENPDVNILATEVCSVSNWQTAPYDIVKAWIVKYGDDIDAILGTWDGIGWGASRAIADSGLNKDNIFTMAIDGSEQTYDLMRKGDPFVGVIAQNFAGWSEVDGDAIQAVVVEGKDPKDVVPPSKTVYVPYMWIDATNVPAKGEGVDFNYIGLFE